MAIQSKYRSQSVISAMVLFVVSLFLTAHSAKHREVGQMAHSSISLIFSPVEAINSIASGGIGDVREFFEALFRAKDENLELRERLANLESQNAELAELRAENKRLKGLVRMKEINNIDGVSARVIGASPPSWSRAFTINRGSLDGVKIGMAVLSKNGVVGQISAVSPKTSRILLLVDASSGIDAIVEGSRARGVVEGDGKNGCNLLYVERSEAVAIGDRIITSGMDGVYPKGVVIGQVAAIKGSALGQFHEIEVRPAVGLSRLEDVFIVMNPQ